MLVPGSNGNVRVKVGALPPLVMLPAAHTSRVRAPLARLIWRAHAAVPTELAIDEMVVDWGNATRIKVWPLTVLLASATVRVVPVPVDVTLIDCVTAQATSGHRNSQINRLAWRKDSCAAKHVCADVP